MLVLDTDADLDLHHDVEAKQQLSRKVSDYFEWVNLIKEQEEGRAGGLLAGASQLVHAVSQQDREMVARSMRHPALVANDMRMQMRREHQQPIVSSEGWGLGPSGGSGYVTCWCGARGGTCAVSEAYSLQGKK